MNQQSSAIYKKLLTLNNGRTIPAVGLGTWKMKEESEVFGAVKSAYEAGYRHIDSAVFYGNESQIGAALKKYNIPREEIFITTKIPTTAMEYKKAKDIIDESLIKFQTEYIDLYLIHWPGAKSVEDRQSVWKALEESVEEGKVRSIGVSNFLPRHLKTILEVCKIKPAVNQIELHPLFIDEETIKLCEKENILVEAYATFARMDPKLIENPKLLDLSIKYKKKPTQILMRWAVQHGWVVIPKSSKPERIAQNISMDDFELTPGEIAELDSQNCKYKISWNPERIEF